MGLLVDLREQAAAFLATDVASGGQAFFTPAAPAVQIPVVTEKKGALEQRINDGLARVGLSVLVATVVAKKARNIIPGYLALDDVLLVFHVKGTPNANPSGVEPSDCAEKIWWVIRHFKFNGAPPLLQSIGLSGADKTPGRVCYDVIFTLDTKTNVEPLRSALVVAVTDDAGTAVVDSHPTLVTSA